MPAAWLSCVARRQEHQNSQRTSNSNVNALQNTAMGTYQEHSRRPSEILGTRRFRCGFPQKRGGAASHQHHLPELEPRHAKSGPGKTSYTCRQPDDSTCTPPVG
eukprot:3392191-Rhodomonas_salina.1